MSRSSREHRSSTQDRVEPHVLAHLGPLLLVLHQQLAVTSVLTFLLGLGREDEAAHRPAGQLALVLVASPEAGGGLLAEGFDDLVFHRDEELGMARVALSGTTAGELTVDPQRLMPLG